MEVILFTIGLAVFFLIPGLLILNWTGLGLHGLTRLNLAVITGIISSSLAYKLFGYLGLPWLTVVYFVLMAAVYLKSLYENRSRLEIRLPDAGTLLTYILFAVLIVYTSYQYTQIPSYSLNLVTVGDDAILAVKNKDALLHLSLVNEIARELPPTTPFISGMELKYHYGMDLLSAMFVKYLGFTAADAALRYMPIFAMSLALLSIFTLVREVGGSPLAALVISYLVIWADDFSYLLYQWVTSGGGFEGMSARLYYTAPSFYSLFFINPMVYGLAFLFTSFLLINKYSETASNRYLLLSAVVICYAGQFKVFITLQILAALALLLLWELYKERRHIAGNPVFRLFVTTSAVFVVMYFSTIMDSLRGVGLVKMELQLFTNYIPGIIRYFGLYDLVLFDTLYGSYMHESLGLLSIVLLIVAVIAYVCFSFGLRCLAFPYMYVEIKRGEASALALAAIFVIIGPLLTLFMSVRPWHGPEGYNNSVWFMVQSKYLAWLFLFIPLSGLLLMRPMRKRKAVNASMLAIFAVLVVYSVKANYLLLDYYKLDPVFQPETLGKDRSIPLRCRWNPSGLEIKIQL